MNILDFCFSENQRRTISVVMPTADDALGDEAFSQLFYDFLKSHEVSLIVLKRF